MTKLNSPAIRKGVFAIAAVALVSTTGGIAFAQSNGNGQIQAMFNGLGLIGKPAHANNGNGNGNNNGYGNDKHRQKEIQKLFKRVARANQEFEHTVLHSLWKNAKNLTPSQYVQYQNAAATYKNSVNTAQANFVAAVNAAANSTTTDAQFNAAFDAAQATYLNTIKQAETTFLATATSQMVVRSRLANDLREARDVLNAYLDFAQAKFVQKTGTDEKNRGNSAKVQSDDSDDISGDDSERQSVGKYNGNSQQFKVDKSQDQQDK